MPTGERGHRSVPHVADVRIEAWAPTREMCLAEAVLGTVEAFLDASSAHAQTSRRCRPADSSDEDVLVAVLNEVIYLLHTTRQIPVDVEVDVVDGGMDVEFAMAEAAPLPQIGAVPKGVSLHQLRFGEGPRGWTCSVILDV